MSVRRCLLDVPVEETKEVGDDTTYFFIRDEHAKCLLANLGEMQANEGLLTDVVVYTGSKDYSEKFHRILLAACSPVVKKHLVGKSSISSEESITLQDMTKEMLEFIRDLIYKSVVTLDQDILNLDDLHNFAVKYDIDFLQETCEKCKDTLVGSPQMEVSFHGHEDVLLELFHMFLKKELTTMVLEDNEGKTQFHVQGPLIAAASPMLKEVMLRDTPARGTKKLRLEISSAALEELVEYIYSAKVTLRSQNVFGLLEAACIYQMPALAKVCCDWLIARLDTYGVVDILCLVRNLDSGYTRGLEEAVRNYIVLNFSELSAKEDFTSLWYDDLKEVIEDDELNVETEEDVFGVVMRWIEFDENSRLPLICDILPSIRLEKTSFEFLDAVEDDPRIGNCPRCRQELDWAREKLDLPKDESSSSSTVTEDYDYEQGSRAASDNTSSFQFSDATFLKEDDGFSSVSAPLYGRPVPQECLHDSDQQPSETLASLRKDGRPDMRFKENRELLLAKGKNKNGRPDNRFRESIEKATDPLKRNSTSDMSYRDDVEGLDDSSSHHFSEDSFLLDDYDNFSSVSGPDYRSCLPQDSLDDGYQLRDTRLRKDGQPDMRFKENRELYLEEGTNRNGSPDKRLKEKRAHVQGPLKKNGTPDMRYKVNREAFSQKGGMAEFPFTSAERQRLGPMKKNGTPDMRFKVNQEALRSSNPRSLFTTFVSETPYLSGCYTGPQKKDGTPDMRYAVNKQLYGTCFVSNSVPPGPLKKNGAPDMRYAINKELYGASNSVSNSVPRGPLKKNGTPEMRYAANKQSYGHAPPSPVARGPLKKDGTPDMRFKANKR